jgi:hypothetical protein
VRISLERRSNQADVPIGGSSKGCDQVEELKQAFGVRLRIRRGSSGRYRVIAEIKIYLQQGPNA